VEYVTKKTTELTADERGTYCRLFKEVLGRDFTLDDFATKYNSPAFGYSYHGLMMDGGQIVGSNSIVPIHYDYFGTRTLFGLDLDTMIAKSHRGKDVMALKKMWESSIPVMKADGMTLVFGCPNQIAHPFWIKVNKWTMIAQLEYYMLPIRVSKLAKVPAIADVASRIGCGVLNAVAALMPGGRTPVAPPIAKVRDAAFEAYRFGGYFKNYRRLGFGQGGTVDYTVVDEERARAAYIIDVLPFGPHALRQAVRAVYRREKRNVDAILYVGHLPFPSVNLVKVPRKYEPVPVRMSYKILDDTVVDERAGKVESWRVNLSTIDVR
jgi:hypothetical protein